jgi:hypothetical protein
MAEKDYSEETARIIDEEIRRFVDEAYADATRLLEEHWDHVVAVAEALLKFETLSEADVARLMEGEPLTKPTVAQPGVTRRVASEHRSCVVRAATVRERPWCCGTSSRSVISSGPAHPPASVKPHASKPFGGEPACRCAADAIPYDPMKCDADHQRVMSALKRVWGYDTLRPLQAEAIEAGLQRRDALVVMPTGGGKSLCYQIPPLVTGRTDVVVSPLIALMKDQVDGLQQVGYPAAALHSGLSTAERNEVQQGLRDNAYRLIFVAPERVVSPWFLRWAERLNVHAFAIDEAHCISQWGHDFRPEYRQLAILRQRFPRPAFTPTPPPPPRGCGRTSSINCSCANRRNSSGGSIDRTSPTASCRRSIASSRWPRWWPGTRAKR